MFQIPVMLVFIPLWLQCVRIRGEVGIGDTDKVATSLISIRCLYNSRLLHSAHETSKAPLKSITRTRILYRVDRPLDLDAYAASTGSSPSTRCTPGLPMIPTIFSHGQLTSPIPMGLHVTLVMQVRGLYKGSCGESPDPLQGISLKK